MKKAALFPSGLSLNLSSNDAEEMQEQSAFWSYEHKQFSRGAFNGKIFAYHTQQLQLTSVDRSAGFFARGGLPSETTIISFPLTPANSLHYRGQLMEDCQALALEHTEELELHTALPSTLLTIAVSTPLLEQQCRITTGNSLADLRCQERLFLNPKEYQVRTNHLVSLMHSLRCRKNPLNEREEGLVEKEILETILLGVNPPGAVKKMANRLSVAKKTEEYIRNNLREPLSINELCRVAGTSERALHHGFKERFGISPKAYIQMMRLNGIHQDLLRNNSNMTVTESALAWGITHLGRFSEQYSRMFGELPSETRKKTFLN